MADERPNLAPGPHADRPSSGDELEGLYGVTEDLVRDIAAALEEGHREQVALLIAPLHVADLADLIQQLPADQRSALVEVIGTKVDPELFAYLDDTVRAELLAALPPEAVAALLRELDSDDALALIEALDEDQQRAVLQAMPAPERILVEEGLAFPEESAGRLMQREVVVVPIFWTVGDVIDYLRATEGLPDDFYDLFVVDPRRKLLGAVPVSRLLRQRRPLRIADIMNREIKQIPVTMDREEVAFLFRQYGLVEAPVVDAGGRLLGVVTVDDVVNVVAEEAEEDLLKLGGVREEDLYRSVIDTAKSRFPWLFVNLGTAFLGSLVIGMFASTIEQIVALAVLMPIVASMGGNAGTQTMTVAVRALATRQLTAANAWRVIGKELIVAAANGVLFAVLVGGVTWVRFDSVAIGAIIGAALIVNLIVAALGGAMLPLALERLGADPAVASGVFLTMLTDVVGFVAFLGLASLLLL